MQPMLQALLINKPYKLVLRSALSGLGTSMQPQRRASVGNS